MNQDQLISFIKVFHTNLGQDVPLPHDILELIQEKIQKNLKYCEFGKHYKFKEDVPLRTPTLGYDFVCDTCWRCSFINWNHEDGFW